jgi:phage terminase large subunit GpA-like protein
MVQAGEWETKNPGGRAIGYHLSSLYSLLGESCTFGEIAASYIRARMSKRAEEIESFVNGYLAWPYEEEEFGLDTISIREIVEQKTGHRRNQLPENVKIICGFADVHRHSLYWCIWGWGGAGKLDRTGWLLAWGMEQIDIDNDQAGVQSILRTIKSMTFQGEGRKLGVIALGIDSGYHTGSVYSWCQADRWLRACKGTRGEVRCPDGLGKFIDHSSKINKMPSGKVIQDGIILYTLNTGFLKREIYGAINSGDMILPVDIDSQYIDQLNSEKLVTRIGIRSKKIEKFYVKKTRQHDDADTTQNHYLDCTVGARAMLEVLAAGMLLDDAAKRYYPRPRPRERARLMEV